MRFFIGILFLSALLSGCHKDEFPDGTPRCVRKKILGERENCLQKVYRYQYNGNEVYLFVNSNCPDAYDELCSKDCDLICYPTGGLSGNGDGNCTDFSQNATGESLIWEKE